ncbi:MAG: HEAT repeat domain-containing protein [Planctomycetes bacterium]|nr:HEAT repeat domain-containing protein [Planctomycetota bacterium]
MITQRFGQLLFLPVMALVAAVAMISGCVHDVEKLSEQLKSPDSMVRWKAAEKLGQTNNVDAVAPLIEALGDTELEVRNAASDSLVQLGRPSVKPLIATLKGSNLQAKEMALETLGTMGDKIGPAGAAAVTAMLKDKSAQIRITATKMLVKLEHISSIVALETCLKNSKEPQVKVALQAAIKKLNAVALARRAAKIQAAEKAQTKPAKAPAPKKSPAKTIAPGPKTKTKT